MGFFRLYSYRYFSAFLRKKQVSFDESMNTLSVSLFYVRYLVELHYSQKVLVTLRPQTAIILSLGIFLCLSLPFQSFWSWPTSKANTSTPPQPERSAHVHKRILWLSSRAKIWQCRRLMVFSKLSCLFPFPRSCTYHVLRYMIFLWQQ